MNSDDKELEITINEKDFREAVREGVQDGIENSVLPEVVDTLKKITHKTKLATLLCQAIKYNRQGKYQQASDVYLQLAELDEERKDTYLRRSQEALALNDQ